MLSSPDEWTQVNSTGVDKAKKDPKLEATGSAIEAERDFDDSYDDSLILRTKSVKTSAESGFESANTFSFDQSNEKKCEFGGATGMSRLLRMEKKPLQDGFKIKILQRKVRTYL